MAELAARFLSQGVGKTSENGEEASTGSSEAPLSDGTDQNQEIQSSSQLNKPSNYADEDENDDPQTVSNSQAIAAPTKGPLDPSDPYDGTDYSRKSLPNLTDLDRSAYKEVGDDGPPEDATEYPTDDNNAA
jgi:hypothetical protein